MWNSSLKKEKGITLIALVITIIVMLILVAVTINIAVNGGLFDYAKTAKTKTEVAMEEEQKYTKLKNNLDYNGLITKYTTNKAEDLAKLKQYFEGKLDSEIAEEIIAETPEGFITSRKQFINNEIISDARSSIMTISSVGMLTIDYHDYLYKITYELVGGTPRDPGTPKYILVEAINDIESLAIRVRTYGEYIKSDDDKFFFEYEDKTYKLTTSSIEEVEDESDEGNTIVITYNTDTLEIDSNPNQTWYEWATDIENKDDLTLTGMDTRYPNMTLKGIITRANNHSDKSISYFRDDLYLDGIPFGTFYPAASCSFVKNGKIVKTTDYLTPGEYTVLSGTEAVEVAPSSGIFPLWFEQR